MGMDGEGATVTIGGIMANASTVGDGNDVTAEVRVNGVVIKHSPIKLADVTTGLDIEVTAASGLQCEAPSMAVATIMFTEGFSSAISAEHDTLVLNFRGIPDGVTVMASLTGTGTAIETDMSDLAPLMLKVDAGADSDGMVSLSSAGNGEVMYEFDTGNLVEEATNGDPYCYRRRHERME